MILWRSLLVAHLGFNASHQQTDLRDGPYQTPSSSSLSHLTGHVLEQCHQAPTAVHVPRCRACNRPARRDANILQYYAPTASRCPTYSDRTLEHCILCGQPNPQLCSFHPDIQLHFATIGISYPAPITMGQYLRIIPGLCLPCTADNHALLHTHHHYNPTSHTYRSPYYHHYNPTTTTTHDTPSCCWTPQVHINLCANHLHIRLPAHITTTSTTTSYPFCPTQGSHAGNRSNDDKEESNADLTPTTQPYPIIDPPQYKNNHFPSCNAPNLLLMMITLLTTTTALCYCASTTQVTQCHINNTLTTTNTTRNRSTRITRAYRHFILLLTIAISKSPIESVKTGVTPAWPRRCSCNTCELHWFRNGWICQVTFRAQAHPRARWRNTRSTEDTNRLGLLWLALLGNGRWLLTTNNEHGVAIYDHCGQTAFIPYEITAHETSPRNHTTSSSASRRGNASTSGSGG